MFTYRSTVLTGVPVIRVYQSRRYQRATRRKPQRHTRIDRTISKVHYQLEKTNADGMDRQTNQLINNHNVYRL
jgi:hypothetical protein